jgi:hypothetical protein
MAEASAYESSDAAPESSVIAYGMKDVVNWHFTLWIEGGGRGNGRRMR